MEPFDLVLLHGAPLFLKFEVVAHDGLIDCRGRDVLNEFEVDVICKFQDIIKTMGISYLQGLACRLKFCFP
jgi:hypothetical protein